MDHMPSAPGPLVCRPQAAVTVRGREGGLGVWCGRHPKGTLLGRWILFPGPWFRAWSVFSSSRARSKCESGSLLVGGSGGGDEPEETLFPLRAAQ